MKIFLMTLPFLFCLLLTSCGDNRDRTIEQEEEYPRPERELPGLNR